MKKFLSILVIMAMLFGFAGCEFFEDYEEEPEEAIAEDEAGEDEESEKEKVRKSRVKALKLNVERAGDYYYDYYYSQELASLSYEIIHLSDEDAEEYPQLSGALGKLGKESAESITAEYEEIKTWAYEHYENASDYFIPYEVTKSVSVRRADSNVLSFLSSVYSYTGGAHGNGGYQGYTFDVKTGEELLISDVVNDTERLYELIEENIDKDALYPDTDIAEVLRGYEEINYTFENGGITVYFNPYEIGPYASGLIKVYLSEEENPGLINEKYLEGAKSFAVNLGSGDAFYYDVTGDGISDEITYYAYESFDSEGHVRIGAGENYYEDEAWFFSADAYFVHMEDGGNYVVAEYGFESDYREIVCYEIGNGITKLETIEGGFAYVNIGGEYSNAREILTNPESFNLDKRYDDLGTSSVYAEHSINSSGNIETKEKLWHVIWQQEATVLMSFEADVYNEKKDKIKGKYTLTEGETVKIYAWDEEGYSYLGTEDGTVLRVFVDDSSWPRTIDGIDIEELFEGLMYAG